MESVEIANPPVAYKNRRGLNYKNIAYLLERAAHISDIPLEITSLPNGILLESGMPQARAQFLVIRDNTVTAYYVQISNTRITSAENNWHKEIIELYQLFI